MKADDPIRPSREYLSRQQWNGLTARNHIAIEVMNGMMDAYLKQEVDDFGYAEVARECYAIADAMIAESEK